MDRDFRFGAERRGAPVTAYVRISDKPVLRLGMFSRADLAAIFDHRLIQLGEVEEYMSCTGTSRGMGGLRVCNCRSQIRG